MKTWTPAEDELLQQLVRRNWSSPQVAARFGCSAEDVAERYAFLTKKANEAPEPSKNPSQRLLNPEELARMQEDLNALQAPFLGLCASYNEMGERLKAISEIVSVTMAAPELEEMFTEFLAQPRSRADETPGQKLARLFAKHCIAIRVVRS